MIERYFLKLESLIYTCHIVKKVLSIETEVVDSNRGWFKAKLLVNDHELRIFEYVDIKVEKVQLLKYGYHLQTRSGSLIIRWDNAWHHREIKTFPHHVHIKDEKNVQPSEEMNLEKVLGRISLL